MQISSRYLQFEIITQTKNIFTRYPVNNFLLKIFLATLLEGKESNKIVLVKKKIIITVF